jgi:hypothetical protein
LVVGTATLSVEVMPVFDRFVIATKKLKLTLLFAPSKTLHHEDEVIPKFFWPISFRKP